MVLDELAHWRTYGITLFRDRGLLVAAKSALKHWYRLAEEEQLYTEQVRALLVYGLNWLRLNRNTEALTAFEKALALIQEHNIQDKILQANVSFDLALAYEQTGDIQKSLEYAEKAWQLTKQNGEMERKAYVTLLLGKLHIDNETWDLAYKYSQEALNTYEQLNEPTGIGKALNNLGLICIEVGQYSQAERLLQKALHIKERRNDLAGAVYTLTELGRLYFKRGDVDDAIRYGRKALETLWDSVAFMDKAEVARLCRLFGSIALVTHDRQGAIGYLQRAITYYAQLNQWREWSAVTKELDEVIRTGVRPSGTRVRIAWREKENLQQLTTLLGLMDTLEGLYPDLRAKTELVTKYALLIADTAGLSEEDRTSLSYAGRLANIGVTLYGNEVEVNDGLPTSGQTQYPYLAEKVLSIVSVSEQCKQAIYHQHEYMDGTGYPAGLRGEDIPLLSRILAIADAYVTHALSAKWKGDVHAGGVQYLQQHMGTRYDPKLVNVFIEMHDMSKGI